MNALCKLLGIDVPVFGFSHCRDVVAAISRAGGFGVLGGGVEPDQLEMELRWIDAHVDGKPYGIDFLMPSGMNTVELHGDAIPAAQRDYVERVLAANNIGTLRDGEVAELQQHLVSKFAITPKHHEKLIDIAFSHPIKLLAAGLGVPSPELITRAHSLDIKIGALVGSPGQAKRQLEAGVDLLISQGAEAGGHTGSISTMVLTPQIVDLAGDVPVLAAGGIANGRQMAAAMALGAQGVWCGSVWLTTAESDVEPAIKDKILAAASSDAVISHAMTGKRNRVLRSGWTNAWEQTGAPPTLGMPFQHLLAQEAMKRARRSNAPGFLSWPAGQVIGQMNEVTSVREIMFRMLSEFGDTVSHMAGQLELSGED